jgi:predicted heme/steroid binding protein
MSIVAIDGHRFETEKAKKSWELSHFDGHNRHTGRLYLSSRGTWYVSTPSQWSNGHRWELIDPATAIERYSEHLEQGEVAEILELAKLDTE